MLWLGLIIALVFGLYIAFDRYDTTGDYYDGDDDV